MAYRRQVEYLDECVPEYVNLNGEEFRRVSGWIESVLLDLGAAHTRVEWDSSAKDLYASRLREADNLAHELRAAFMTAGPALVTYGQELAKAKASVANGDAAAKSLQELMNPIIGYQTPTFRDSESLVQWEDLRERTSPFDWAIEFDLREEVDHIRGRANGFYLQAAHAYDDALRVEQEARAQCLTEMLAASAKLPDFLADSTAARDIVRTAPGVMVEMTEAAAIDEHVRLPGQGVVPTFGVETTDLSDTHQDIRNRAANVSFDNMTWTTADSANWLPVIGDEESEHRFKLEWIRNYGPAIQSAAAEYGIPADVLAGVIYMEVGGKPLWMDDAVDWARQNTPFPGLPDDTSYGPLAVQVDTAATALGYDPAQLTGEQRDEIIASLKDPEQNIMITAKVLADAKDGTDFAYTEPEDMTEDQGRRLAATYRSGAANWEGGDGREYADEYSKHIGEAKEALR